MSYLYDPIRKKQVADTPEERVRQALLFQMIGPLGFPKSLLAVEKRLDRFFPGELSRRADIVAFIKSGDELKPLLLIECKAEEIDEETYMQAAGYNSLLAAPFICLAHAGGIRTFSKLQSVPFLPPYSQLRSSWTMKIAT